MMRAAWIEAEAEQGSGAEGREVGGVRIDAHHCRAHGADRARRIASGARGPRDARGPHRSLASRGLSFLALLIVGILVPGVGSAQAPSAAPATPFADPSAAPTAAPSTATTDPVTPTDEALLGEWAGLFTVVGQDDGGFMRLLIAHDGEGWGISSSVVDDTDRVPGDVLEWTVRDGAFTYKQIYEGDDEVEGVELVVSGRREGGVIAGRIEARLGDTVLGVANYRLARMEQGDAEPSP